MFLRTSQNSHEKTCAGVSNKVASRGNTYLSEHMKTAVSIP